MRQALPLELRTTAVAVGGAFVVAGISLFLVTVAVWIASLFTADLLVKPLVPILEWVGPALLAFAIFRLPKSS